MKSEIKEVLDKIWKELKGVKGKINGLEGRFEGLEGRFDGLEKSVAEIKEMFATKKNIMALKNYVDERFNEIEAKMFTKEDYMKHMTTIDDMITESKEAARDRKVYSDRYARLSDQVVNHEKRLKSIGA